MNNIVGTCGNCGGCVAIPQAWYSTNPPRPQCLQCGASPVEAFGPVLAMKPFDQAIAGYVKTVFRSGDL